MTGYAARAIQAAGTALRAIWTNTPRTPSPAAPAIRNAFPTLAPEYEALEQLSTSDSAYVVLKANHPKFGQPIAVKMLRNQTPVHQNRLESEISALRLLEGSSYSTPVFEDGYTPDSRRYFAMEFVHGFNLHQVIQRFGPMPDCRVRHILSDVCEFLSELHNHQMTHSDIKPSNIILSAPRTTDCKESIKVVDLGLASHFGTESTEKRKKPETIAGTPAFLAPEIAEGHSGCPLSDIYSLGCVAYYLLTGVQPFTGRTSIEICWKQIHEAPIVPSVTAGRTISVALQSLVLSCMAKSPADRPTSARQVAEQLAEAKLDG